jgi:asparagine synthase (glutamine-hydrolysing)
LDTRMIMACLPPLAAKPITYTFSGRTENILDARIAGKIAAALGLEHRVLRIGDDFLRDFGHWVDRSVYISDGCCSATGAHEIYYNRQAAQLAPVRLTGNFGSEVFRSVSTFKPLGLDPSLLAPDMARRVNDIEAGMRAASINPVTFAAFQEIPWSLVGTLFTGRSKVTFRTPYLDNELVELAYRAPLAHRPSPLPALRLIEEANPRLARIPTDRGQIGTRRGAAWLFRRLFAETTFKLDYYRAEGLPGRLAPLTPLLKLGHPLGLLGLHKFLPYSRWFRSELQPYLREAVTDSSTRSLPGFATTFLEPMIEAHASGRKNYTREINAILALGSVARNLLTKQPAGFATK